MLLRTLACFLLLALLPLASLAQTTAEANVAAATAVAGQGQSRMDLLAVVATSANPDGTAPNWLYLYQTDDSALAGVFTTGDVVANAALDLTEVGIDPAALIGLASPDPRGTGWRDSDDAIRRAEEQGGSDFRAANPDATLSAVLLDFPAENLIDLPGIEQLGPYWLIAYTAAASSATEIFIVESRTGILFSLDAVGGDNPPTLESTAAAFAADAERIAMASVLPDLSTEGGSLFWQHTYYSPSQGVAHDFFVSLTGLVLGEAEASTPAILTPLPTAHLDAGEALAVAFPEIDIPADVRIGPLVQGRLGYGLNGDVAQLGWVFGVITMDAAGRVETQFLFVDAVTGNVLRVANESATDLPASAQLAANYPNPFRTATTVQYTVAATTRVTLAVYDLLGRSVHTLTEGLRGPGTYQVGWNGADASGQRLPSGLYLYRLTTSDGATQTRSLVLLD
ncbi:MAG: FlgD immunoglobulin-like domain containing protein [Bacteroidota bacterium]